MISWNLLFTAEWVGWTIREDALRLRQCENIRNADTPGSGHGDDAAKWDVDPARTASEIDAGYYRKLLEKAWAEAAFVFCHLRLEGGSMHNPGFFDSRII
jgi:hypothetical protein